MDKKRVHGFIFIFLFLIVIVTGIVSAATLASIFDPVKDLFVNWNQGDLSVNIAKYVFWGIVGLFIFSILAFVPFVSGEKKVVIRVILAVLISFLAIAYLTPSNIYTMLASYGALGFVLGAGLPFIILAFFSIEMSKQGVGGKIIAKLVWIIFIVYLIYKVVSGMITTPGIELFEGIIYLAAIVSCLIYMYWGENKLLKLIFKEEMSGMKEALFQEVEKEDILKKTKAREWEAAKARLRK